MLPAIADRGPTSTANTGITEAEFKAACDQSFEDVYGGARRKAKTLFHPGYRKRYVQLIKTGGGCRTPVHERFIAEMTKGGVLGDVPPIEPMPPAGITDEDCDRARLLLAYGLTLDVQQLLDPRLPSDIDPLPEPPSPIPPMITNDDM